MADGVIFQTIDLCVSLLWNRIYDLFYSTCQRKFFSNCFTLDAA